MDNFEGKSSSQASHAELTVSKGKSYHGSMAEPGAVETVKPDISKEAVNENDPRGIVVDGVYLTDKKADSGGRAKDGVQKVLPKDAHQDEEGARKKSGREKTAIKKAEEPAKRAEYIEESKGKSKEGSGILKSIMEALYEILKAIFPGEDNESLAKRINDSEAMRSIAAYAAFKPQSEWKPIDYVRVISIIGPDTSPVALTLKSQLEKDAISQGYGTELFLRRAEIYNKNFRLTSQDSWRGASDSVRSEDAVRRSAAMNYELWSGMVMTGEIDGRLRSLSPTELMFLENFWSDCKNKTKETSFHADEIDSILSKIAKEKKTRSTSASSSSGGRGTTGAVLSADDEAGGPGGSGNEPPGRRPPGGGPPSGGGGDLTGTTRSVDDNTRGPGGGGEPPSGRPPGGGGGRGPMERTATATEKSAETLTEVSQKLTDIHSELIKMNRTLLEIKNEINTLSGELIKYMDDPGKSAEARDKLIQQDNAQREVIKEQFRKLNLIQDPNERIRMLYKLYEDQQRSLRDSYNHKITQATSQQREALLAERDAELERVDKQHTDHIEQVRSQYESGKNVNLIEMSPWAPEDAELYDGNVDEVNEERMMRIVYFNAMSNGTWGNVKNDPLFNADNPNLSKQERARKADFIERMEKFKVYENLVKKDELINEESKYMREMQRWVKVIKENSQYGKGELKIDNSAYEAFEKVLATKTHLASYGDINSKNTKKEYFKAMNEAVGILKQEKFTDYFRETDKDGNIVRRYDYGEARAQIREGSVPNSIWETCALIQKVYPSEGYRTGEEHELINENGELMVNNLLYWMYHRVYERSDRSSQGAINSLQEVTLRTTYVDLALVQFLEVPQYSMFRKFKMKGDVSGENKKELGKGGVNAGWGKLEEHPDFSFARREVIKRWVWNFDFRHTDGVKFMDNAVKLKRNKWVEVLYDIIRNGNYLRSGYTYLWHQAPSSRGDEVEQYFNGDKQGSVGMAGRDAVLFYNYLTSFSEHYMERNAKDGSAEGVNGYEKNMAYRSLGMDGANAFLLTLAEQGLYYGPKETSPMMKKDDTNNKLRKVYKGYIQHLMSDLIGEYESKYGRDEKKAETLKNLRAKYITPSTSVKNEMKMLFDSNSELENLQLSLVKLVDGHEVVNDEVEEKWEGSKDRIVSRSAIRGLVKLRMRAGLKEKFFDSIKSIPIETTDTSGNTVVSKIGDITMLTDGNGRVVTSEEYKELGRNTDVTTIGKIMDEFAGFERRDELDFAKEWENAKGDKNKEDALLMEYEKDLKRNERLAMAFITKIANLKRKDLNWFNQAKPSETVKKITRAALSESLAKVYKLPEWETKFVDDGAFYVTDTYLMSARNNTSNDPLVNQGSWFTNTLEVAINELGIDPKSPILRQILRLTPGTLWEFTEVKWQGQKEPMTIAEHMQGGAGGNMTERCARRQDGSRRLADTSRDDLQDTFNNIVVFGDQWLDTLTSEETLSLSDCMKWDNSVSPGRLVFDRQKAHAAMKKWWEPLHRVFDKPNTKYSREIVCEGRVMTVEEAMFGSKILESKKTMKKYYKMKASWSKGDIAKQYEALADEIDNDPAIAVFSYMAAATVAEHSHIFNSTDETWEIQQIREFTAFLEEYLRKPGEKVMKNGKVDVAQTISRLPFSLFNEVMEDTEKTYMEKIMFWHLFWSLIFGIIEGHNTDNALKEIGEAYTGSVQPVRAVS